MIYEVTITNPNDELLPLTLTNPVASGFNVLDIQGLGPAKANINIKENSSISGSTFNSSKTPSRNIVFTLGFLASPTIEATRLRTYRYFPTESRIKIEVLTDAGLFYIYGYVESNEPTIFSQNEGCTISVICPDPFFKKENDERGDSINAVASLFEFDDESGGFSNELNYNPTFTSAGTDNFTGTNGASLGVNWTDVGTPYSSPTIQSNAFYGGAVAAYYNPVGDLVNFKMAATVVANYRFFMFGMVDANNFWRVLATLDGGNLKYKLQQRVGGSFTDIYTSGIASTATTAYVQVSSNRLKMWTNVDASLIDQQLTGYTGGKVGLGCSSTSSIDDFVVYTTTYTGKVINFGERFFQSVDFNVLSEATTDVEPKLILAADGGAVVDPEIYFENKYDPNVTDSLKFVFTTDLPALEDGDYLEIVCERQNKSVRRYVAASQTFMNYLGAVTIDSSWPVLKPGDNTFSYDAATGAAYIRFSYEYTPKYVGV